jgi:hypothetical protein
MRQSGTAGGTVEAFSQVFYGGGGWMQRDAMLQSLRIIRIFPGITAGPEDANRSDASFSSCLAAGRSRFFVCTPRTRSHVATVLSAR